MFYQKLISKGEIMTDLHETTIKTGRALTAIAAITTVVVFLCLEAFTSGMQLQKLYLDLKSTGEQNAAKIEAVEVRVTHLEKLEDE